MMSNWFDFDLHATLSKLKVCKVTSSPEAQLQKDKDDKVDLNTPQSVKIFTNSDLYFFSISQQYDTHNNMTVKPGLYL